MFVLMKSGKSLKVGHVESKTRSLGKILEKPCIPSRGHIFCSIIMKRGQNVCLNEIWDELESGSCRVKNLVTLKIFEKPCVKLCKL